MKDTNDGASSHNTREAVNASAVGELRVVRNSRLGKGVGFEARNDGVRRLEVIIVSARRLRYRRGVYGCVEYRIRRVDGFGPGLGE